MKIFLLAPQPFYQDRGTPIAVKLLAQTLVRQGHSVHLLVFAEGEEIDMPGVILHRHVRLPGMRGVRPGLSPKKLYCDLFFFFSALRLVRQHHFDLVHAVEESVFMAVFFKRLSGLPYVYDMDSSMSTQIVDRFSWSAPLQRPMEWLEKQAIRGSAGVVVVCESLARTVHRLAPGKHLARIEDVTLLDLHQEQGEDLRRELDISGPLLLYVGNLEPYQGIDLLLDAMKVALATRPDLSLVLIGGSEKDMHRYTLRAKELEIASKVFFCGPRPVNMLASYLNQADILLSPRVQGQNTPMKIYSYLDSGKPVLATDLPTHTQVLDPAISCLVAPEPEAMAGGILTLAGDPSLRDTLGGRARQRVAQEYSLPAFERKLARFYEGLAMAGGLSEKV